MCVMLTLKNFNSIQFRVVFIRFIQSRILRQNTHCHPSTVIRCGVVYDSWHSRGVIILSTHYSLIHSAHLEMMWCSAHDVVVMDLIFNFPHNLVTLHSTVIGSFDSCWMVVKLDVWWELLFCYCSVHFRNGCV